MVAVTAPNQDPFVWQIDFLHLTHQHLNFAKQLSKGIYDICNFEIARCYLVQHWRKQEKVILANEENFHRVDSGEQFLKMNGRVNTAETTAENDDSFLTRLIRIDHRVLSVAWQPDYSGDCRALFVSGSFTGGTPLGPD